MYQTVIAILGAISLSFIYYYILAIPKLFLRFGIKLVKPFSCPFCMSFWFAFCYMIFNTDRNFIDCLYATTATPFLYLYIEEKIITRWNF